MDDYIEDNVLVIGDSVLKEVGHIRNALVRSFRGDTIQDLNNHLRHDDDLLKGKKIVVIHAGTNDLYNCTVAEMIDDLSQLVDTIHAHYDGACRYIAVSSILPRAKDY